MGKVVPDHRTGISEGTPALGFQLRLGNLEEMGISRGTEGPRRNVEVDKLRQIGWSGVVHNMEAERSYLILDSFRNGEPV